MCDTELSIDVRGKLKIIEKKMTNTKLRKRLSRGH